MFPFKCRDLTISIDSISYGKTDGNHTLGARYKKHSRLKWNAKSSPANTLLWWLGTKNADVLLRDIDELNMKVDE